MHFKDRCDSSEQIQTPKLLSTLPIALAVVFSLGSTKSFAAPSLSEDQSNTGLRIAAAQEGMKKIVRSAETAHNEAEDSAPKAADYGPSITQPHIATGPAPGTHKEEITLESADSENENSDHSKMPASTSAAVPVEEEHQAERTVAKAEPKKAAAKAAAPAAAAAAPAKDQADGPASAETSLRWLTNGNTRYTKKQFRADGRTQADRDRAVKTHQPHAIILTSSDSRVVPEIIFDQGIGEIYTVRVGGPALDDTVIATIESAVQKLQPRLLVVMGHTDSEIIAAALKSEGENSPAIEKLLADIRPRLKTVANEKRSPHLEVEATVNADGVGRNLVERSEIIRKLVESGRLTIKPALYWIDNGKVRFF